MHLIVEGTRYCCSCKTDVLSLSEPRRTAFYHISSSSLFPIHVQGLYEMMMGGIGYTVGPAMGAALYTVSISYQHINSSLINIRLELGMCSTALLPAWWIHLAVHNVWSFRHYLHVNPDSVPSLRRYLLHIDG